MDIFTYKIIYFILALFLGFFLGYILKKENYEKKIQNEVYKIEHDFQESNKKLDITKENFMESENRLKINRDLHKTQKDIIENKKTNINNIKQKLIASQDAFNELDIRDKNLLEDIKEYEKNMEDIRPEYEKIATIFKENEELTIKFETLQEELKEAINQINILEKDKAKFQDKLSELKDYKESLTKELETLNSKITLIHNKENISNSYNEEELTQMAESLKVKVLNYKYKLEDLKNNINKGLNLDKEEIEYFISKNEEERLIDKFLSKIFNFSKKDNK